MSEQALFDENLTKEHGLEHIIRTRLLGVDPDEQDVRLDDDDWRAILAALGEREWQPIETAPKDGSLVLLCLSPHRGYLECPRKVGGWWDDKWNIFGGSWCPTHWQPLPTPPTA